MKIDENQSIKNSDLSPEEQEMRKSSAKFSKRRKAIKKLPVVNLLNSSTIMRNNGNHMPSQLVRQAVNALDK